MAESRTNGEDALHAVEFTSDRERDLFLEARLGETAKDFLLSDIGRYVHGCARQELEECKEQLLLLDPDLDHEYEVKARRIRTRAWNAEHFMSWLTELIQSGDSAYHQLQEETEQE